MHAGFESTAMEVTEGRNLRRKTFLVTGCASGIGRETVRVLALRGATILGAARTREDARRTLAELEIDGHPIGCDLSDVASVRAAASEVRTFGELDGIVANAGVMALPDCRRVNGIEKQFAVNHLGHFVLVTELLHRLSAKGRVVVLSSGALRMAPDVGVRLDDIGYERHPYDPWEAYGQSKLANLLFARSLSKRLAPGQTANAVHPGVIDTRLGRHVPDKAAMYERMKRVMKSVPQGAATSCLVATHPSARNATGQYFSDCKPVRPRHPRAKDDELAEALWLRSMEWTR